MAAGAKAAVAGAGLDPQSSSTQQQRAQLKGQKRRIPPTSKVCKRLEASWVTDTLVKLSFNDMNLVSLQIPSTAVEMPGSADVPGLNLQFGALDFVSESALPEFGVVDNCVGAASREPTPAQTPTLPALGPGAQSQTSLYSKPLRCCRATKSQTYPAFL